MEIVIDSFVYVCKSTREFWAKLLAQSFHSHSFRPLFFPVLRVSLSVESSPFWPEIGQSVCGRLSLSLSRSIFVHWLIDWTLQSSFYRLIDFHSQVVNFFWSADQLIDRLPSSFRLSSFNLLRVFFELLVISVLLFRFHLPLAFLSAQLILIKIDWFKSTCISFLFLSDALYPFICL